MENPRQQPPRLPNLTQLNSNRTTLKSRSMLTFPVSNGFLWQLSEHWKTLGEFLWRESRDCVARVAQLGSWRARLVFGVG
jgi:hypothetical protein